MTSDTAHCARKPALSDFGQRHSCTLQMTRDFKFVATILAFVFLASSLSAFAASLREDPAAMSRCCGPHCPGTMKAVSAGTKPQVKSEGNSCCNGLPRNPVPASATQAPSNRSLAIHLLPATEPLRSAPLSAKTELRDGVPPDGSSPLLAVLCTFLL